MNIIRKCFLIRIWRYYLLKYNQDLVGQFWSNFLLKYVCILWDMAVLASMPAATSANENRVVLHPGVGGGAGQGNLRVFYVFYIVRYLTF
jgi:hypothetical protein